MGLQLRRSHHDKEWYNLQTSKFFRLMDMKVLLSFEGRIRGGSRSPNQPCHSHTRTCWTMQAVTHMVIWLLWQQGSLVTSWNALKWDFISNLRMKDFCLIQIMSLKMPEARNECGTGSGGCCNDHVCYEGEGKLEMNTKRQNNISLSPSRRLRQWWSVCWKFGLRRGQLLHRLWLANVPP